MGKTGIKSCILLLKCHGNREVDICHKLENVEEGGDIYLHFEKN